MNISSVSISPDKKVFEFSTFYGENVKNGAEIELNYKGYVYKLKVFLVSEAHSKITGNTLTTVKCSIISKETINPVIKFFKSLIKF